jgi:hypothetical protein
MNLLELVQQMCYEVGIAAPTQVATSTDPQIQQIYALVNRFGRDLSRQFVWQELDKEYILTTATLVTTGDVTQGSAVISNIPDTTGLTTNWGANFVGAVPFSQLVSVGAGTVTLSQPSEATGVGVPITFGQVNYPLPTDWLRQIEQTEWDRTNRWPLNGPKSAQEWQNFKSGIVYAGPRLRFRIAGNTIQLNPPPSAASLLSMEYVSKNWVTALAGTTKEKFTLDTDTPVFDESLMVEGLKLRWNKAKGFAYDEKAYNVLLSICQAQNKSAPTLSLAQGSSSVLLSTENIPDGNWPGS